MKKVNATLSTLYNFSSQGAFPESEVGFYTPKPDEIIKILPEKAYDLAKNFIKLDRISWISEIVNNDYCPKCNYEKSNYLVPELHP